ncbi:uncharacterized [Tachysurus ichikawai]
METTRQKDIKALIEAVAERQNLYVTKNSVMTGVSAGLASGGLGKLFGAVGYVAAMYWVNEVPLIQALKDLSAEKIEKLYNSVKALLKGLVWPTLEALLNLVMSSDHLQNKITDILQTFFKSLHMVVAPKLL